MTAAAAISECIRCCKALVLNHPALLPLVLVPAAAGFAASAACPMRKNDGKTIPFRPPAWVFGFIWPVLYITFGAAWFLAASSAIDGAKALDATVLLGAAAVSLPYAVCTAAMTAWLPLRAPKCRTVKQQPASTAAGAARLKKQEEDRKKVQAFWVLLVALSAAAFCVALPAQPGAARMLALPLQCWLLVAVLLSYWEFR